MAYTVVKFVEDLIVSLCPSSQIKINDEEELVSTPYLGVYYPAVIVAQGEKKEMTVILNATKRIDKAIVKYNSNVEHATREKKQTLSMKNKAVQTENPLMVGKCTQTCIEEHENPKFEDYAANVIEVELDIPSERCSPNTDISMTNVRRHLFQDLQTSDNYSINDVPGSSYDTTDVSDTTEALNLCNLKYNRKQYFCIYCKKLVINFARHILNNHKDQDEVLSLSGLDKKSKDRKKLIDEIRGRGTLLFNTSHNLNKGNLILRRHRKTSDSKIYRACPQCLNFYKKNYLYRHYQQCKINSGVGKRNLQSTSKSLTIETDIQINASEKLLTDVLPGMRDDEIKKFLIKDPFILDYGNYLCIRHKTEKHLKNLIRTKLRQITNLIITMHNLNSEITSLDSAIRPHYYDSFTKAVNIVAGYSENDGKFRAPSLVTALGTAMKLCAQRLRVYYIKQDDEIKKKSVDQWLQVYESEFYYSLGKTALSDAAKVKWNKPRLLPLTEDILKLNNFLKKSVEDAEEILKNKFNLAAFQNLNKCVLLQILIFNRKRVGEMSRLLITDFENRHNIQKDSEIYKSLNTAEKIVSSRYMRMEIRGKMGRPVSLLLSKKQIELIELILENRKSAGVSGKNEYVFGRNRTGFYSASSALNQIAYECNASHPELLTGTKLRKQIATVSQAMNFTENDMTILADFMGHDIATHRKFYRLPNEVIHLAKLSQMLISLEDGSLSKFHGKGLKDINLDVDLDEEEQNSFDNSTLGGSPIPVEKPETMRRKVSLINKTQLKDKTPPKRKFSVKKPWKTPERHIARRVFATNIKNKFLPTPLECLQVINKHRELKGRTVQQLKAWVNNEIKRLNKI